MDGPTLLPLDRLGPPSVVGERARTSKTLSSSSQNVQHAHIRHFNMPASLAQGVPLMPADVAAASSTPTTAPPPWSELKTKAGKDRKRLPLACVACRRKKIRCSGEKPACKHCIKARTPCVYKVTTRKAGPRTDYMAMLDKRLKRMEERVIKVIPKDSEAATDISRAVLKPSAAKLGDNNKRSAQEAFGEEIDAWARDKNSARDVFAKPGQVVEDGNILTEGKEDLPPIDIQEHLIATYFDYIYGQSYYILHKPSFMRKFAAGTVPPVLILAICAVSSRFSTHPQLQTQPPFLRGEKWSDAARAIALRRFDTPNITILTVLLLLGLHEFGTCRGGRCWMLGGMSHRMSYALQLHKEVVLDGEAKGGSELSWTDREIRRRIMWACFLMDRFNSSGTQRPMFTAQEYMEIQLPVKEHLFIQEIPAETESLNKKGFHTFSENMGVAAHMIRVVTLWGRIVQHLNLGGIERDEWPGWHEKSKHTMFRNEVDQFLETLPEELALNDANLQVHSAENTANQYLYLHIAYFQCVLFIYRFAFPHIRVVELHPDMPQHLLREARSKSLKAAAQMSRLFEIAEEHRVMAPFMGYCAYLSGNVHIHSAFSRDKKLAEAGKRDLAINIRYLTILKKYWGTFHFLSDSLRDIWHNFADLSKKGVSTPMPRTKRAFQYGDWYDKFPHGVSQTDFEEPADAAELETGSDAALSQRADVQNYEEYAANLSPNTKAKRTPRRRRSDDLAKVKKGVQGKNGGKSAATTASSESPNTIQQVSFPASYDTAPMSTVELPVVNGVAQSYWDSSSVPVTGAAAMPQFSSFVDESGAMMGPPGQAPDMTNYFWGIDFGRPSNDTSDHGEEFLQGAGQAWFMPFNINVPGFDGDVSGDSGMLFSPHQQVHAQAHAQQHAQPFPGMSGIPVPLHGTHVLEMDQEDDVQ